MNKFNELKEKYNNADGTVLIGHLNETQDGTAYKLVASKLNDLNNGYVSDHYGVYSGINFRID